MVRHKLVLMLRQLQKKCSGTQDPFPYGKFDRGEESGKVIKGLRA